MFRNCSWCVAKTRDELRSAPRMQLAKMARPTWTSTADSGSSNKQMSALAYTSRAKATRAFCPPDRLMPRSPMMVRSPSDNSVRSRYSSVHWTASS
mmetsp:Transcript_2783/g.8980  ORF Transcript_2783/g.8980 Transcript_2783/m.8980 type:complete len:96 (+) Transcript_2783:61-348(+)